MALNPVPDVEFLTLHNHRRAFVRMGHGPAVLLLHGIGSDHRTWIPVLRPLAKRFTVIAPDLLGHGQSDAPRADYSIAGYANAMRDLLAMQGVSRVTVVGHSLGGGVAMQFAYQYPHLTERLVLVGSGGLGKSVTPLLRALTLPGAGLALRTATAPPLNAPISAAMRAAHSAGLPGSTDLAGLAHVYGALADKGRRTAFRHVLRSVVDWRGQVITMLDRAYLAEGMPSLVIWGEQDKVIPVKHAFAAHHVLPGSQLEVLPHAGHFPHEDDPEHFVAALTDFIRDTRAAEYDGRAWVEAMTAGPRPRTFPRRWSRARAT